MHPEFSAAVKARRAFAKLITGRRPAKRRRGRVAHQQSPRGIQLAYFADLRSKVVQPAHALVQRFLLPELASIVAEASRGDRLDARGPKKVNEVMGKVARAFEPIVTGPGMDELAARYAKATSDKQRAALALQLHASVGVEVPILDKNLGPAIEQFTAVNVSLIKTIPQRYFAQVEAKVIEGVGAGRRWEDIAGDVEKRFDVSESVAKVIARDQVGKFYANLNELRQTNLGITHFYWMTGEDERVCPICEPLHGKRFAWDDPPEEGLPGEVHPQCGCGADPDTDTLLETLDEEEAPEEPTEEPADNEDRLDAGWEEVERDEHGRWAGGGGGREVLMPDRDAALKAHETRRANKAKKEQEENLRRGGTEREVQQAKEQLERDQQVRKEIISQTLKSIEQINRSAAAKRAVATRRAKLAWQNGQTKEMLAKEAVRTAANNGVKGNLAEKFNQEHPRLTALIGTQMHVTGERLQTEKIREIEKLPDGVLGRLKDANVKIVMGDGGVREIARSIATNSWQRENDLSGRPRGWSAGSTFSEVGGVFSPYDNRVIIGGLKGGSVSVALHEIGHSVDSNASAFGLARDERGGGAHNASNHVLFQEAHVKWHNDQMAALNAPPHLLAAARERAGTNRGHPYFNDQRTAEANRSETFAESFASFYGAGGGKAGHENTAKLFGPHIADWHLEHEENITAPSNKTAVKERAAAQREALSSPKTDDWSEVERDEHGKWSGNGTKPELTKGQLAAQKAHATRRANLAKREAEKKAKAPKSRTAMEQAKTTSIPRVKGPDEKMRPGAGPGKQLPAATLERLKELGVSKLPPSHITEVHVSEALGTEAAHNGALLKWKDDKGRQQVAYSAKFNQRNAEKKWERVLANRPKVAAAIEGLQQKAETSPAHAATLLMAQTSLRPGSDHSVEHEGHYGATTIEVRHVSFKDGNAHLKFIGKQGHENKATVTDPHLVQALRNNVKGKGPKDRVFSTDINSIREAAPKGVKLKDLRTTGATNHAERELARYDFKATGDSKKDARQVMGILKAVSTTVSERLNNTPAMARKSYIAPQVIREWAGRQKGINPAWVEL